MSIYILVCSDDARFPSWEPQSSLSLRIVHLPTIITPFSNILRITDSHFPRESESESETISSKSIILTYLCAFDFRWWLFFRGPYQLFLTWLYNFGRILIATSLRGRKWSLPAVKSLTDDSDSRVMRWGVEYFHQVWSRRRSAGDGLGEKKAGIERERKRERERERERPFSIATAIKLSRNTNQISTVTRACSDHLHSPRFPLPIVAVAFLNIYDRSSQTSLESSVRRIFSILSLTRRTNQDNIGKLRV